MMSPEERQFCERVVFGCVVGMGLIILWSAIMH